MSAGARVRTVVVAVVVGLLLAAGARASAPQGGRRQGGRAPLEDDPANAGADLSPKPPVVPLPPAEQARQFWLPPGYRIEPVLSDPDVDNPVQIAFDGNGRMFVVEMRGYVQTPEGADVLEPIGRISVHEDRDDDGVYEHHRVFVDGLLLPRFALPFGADAILALENNGDEMWRYTDTNGDGTADEKELFTTGFGRGGALGGQPSGLVWAMDNWLYSTVNAFRVRWTPNGVLREPTGANRAQWGATQDDDGKMWFQGGASGLPAYFQFPVHYGAFIVPDQLDPDLTTTWGAPILIGDMAEGIPGTRLPDGSLKYVTAGAGNDVFRGDRLPADLVGDYLYGEIVARVVRRLKPVQSEGLTRLGNAYPRSEFIRSLDPLFRPVDMATAPDGTLFVVDMYRGVVEWAQGARRGTYLRRKIDQYQLDRVRTHGRVWRVTYEGIARDRTRPRMLQETPAELVARLAHPNGWWRDTAQQLLVLRQDRSVVPALERMARSSPNLLARFHALWTLEGLAALEAPLVRAAMQDPSPRMRLQAIRASETLYKAGDRSFGDDYRTLASDADTDVVIQALLTLNILKVAGAAEALAMAQAQSPARGVQLVTGTLLNAEAGRGGGPALSAERQSAFERGRTTYNELCFACHGDDGRGAPYPAGGESRAPSLAGSPRVNDHRDYVVSVLLGGLTGPVDGRSYADVMVPMGSNQDPWVADVAGYVRSSFGNAASWVEPADVARVRTATAGRSSPWTVAELTASLPVALVPDGTWRLTASHGAATASDALNLGGWATGVPQQAGMWLQIELPAAVTVTELQFTSPTQGGRRRGPPPVSTFPRGYRVEVSDDGAAWTAPVAQGEGSAGTMRIAFTPVRARFIRLTQTASVDGAPAWSMQRLRLYEAPAGSAARATVSAGPPLE